MKNPGLFRADTGKFLTNPVFLSLILLYLLITTYSSIFRTNQAIFRTNPAKYCEKHLYVGLIQPNFSFVSQGLCLFNNILNIPFGMSSNAVIKFPRKLPIFAITILKIFPSERRENNIFSINTKVFSS